MLLRQRRADDDARDIGHPGSMDASQLQRRVVIHLDLDCFYAQVEAKRLGIDPSVPLAVQQWSGLIAVNYPARHRGVKRHLNVTEAKKLVPELVCVHVETIGDDEGGHVDAETTEDDAHDAAGVGVPTTEKTDGTSHDKQSRKVSLRRYRRASWRVMSALADRCEHVERASIDEAYVDVTREVDAAVATADAAVVDEMVRDGIRASGAVVPLTPSTSEHDRRLAVGAHVCAEIRAAVFERTGFTMSGGVAHNKMLAKLASARNKPNKQTAVSARAVTEMMESLPMRSIKGLGGKLGEKVEAALRRVFGEGSGAGGSGRGSSYEGGFPASALASLHPDALRAELEPKTAAWLSRVAAGEDVEPVVANVREGVKSVNAFKSFAAVDDASGVHRWLRVLSGELAERLVEDRAVLRRQPRHLRLEYRAGLKSTHLRDWHAGRTGELTDVKSKSLGFPPTATNRIAAAAAAWRSSDDDDRDLEEARRCVEDAAAAIAATATRAFDSLGRDALPSTRVGLSATDFAPTPAEGGGIAKFFNPTDAADNRHQVQTSAPSASFPKRIEERKATALDAFLASKTKDPERREATEAGGEAGEAHGEYGAKEKGEALGEDGAEEKEEEGDAAFVTCARCGETHAAGRDAQEHADYHVALDLSRETTFSSAVERPVVVGGAGGGGKRRRTGASGSFKAKSLTSFFGKK